MSPLLLLMGSSSGVDYYVFLKKVLTFPVSYGILYM